MSLFLFLEPEYYEINNEPVFVEWLILIYIIEDTYEMYDMKKRFNFLPW